MKMLTMIMPVKVLENRLIPGVRRGLPSSLLGGLRRKKLLLSLALLLYAGFAPALSLAAEAMRSGYELGRGLPVGESGLVLGGYASLKYVHLDETPAKTEISDLSLFLHWEGGGRWQAFTELEIGEPLVYKNGNLTTDKAEFELERAYVDYLYSDRLSFRLGKSLTPIGYWNSIHADPLIWTVSRPLTTDAGFSHYITGLILQGNIPRERGVWNYRFYLDNSVALDPRPDNPSPTGKRIPGLEIGAFDHARGMHLQYMPDSEQWQFGLSLSHFGIEGYKGHKTLIGFDFLWKSSALELSGEAIYRRDSLNQERDERGGFLQAVRPLVPRWYAVGRYERFKDKAIAGEVETLSLGVAWKPHPATILKLEKRLGKDNDQLAPDGIFASMAVLF